MSETIERMAEAIRSEVQRPDFPETIFFNSLGSPDLVLVSLPLTPGQLQSIHTLIRKIRTMRLHDIRPLDAPEEAWPWLLEISGKSLLRPELCLVHCMHEVAELSEWIETDRCKNLRYCLNRWILKEIVANAIQISSKKQNKIIDQSSDHSLEIVISWCIASACVPNIKSELNDVYKVIDDLCCRIHPEKLVSIVRRALTDTGFPRVPDEILPAINQSNAENGPTMPGVTRQFNNEEFDRALNSLGNLVPELIGDIGMWCAFDHIRGLNPSESRSQGLRINDLCRIYESVIMAVSESRGSKRSRARIERLILHRWAIQAAAILGDNSYHSVILGSLDALRKKCPDLSMSLQAEYQEMLKVSSRLSLQFGVSDGLVSVLRKLRAFGGSEELVFAGLDSFPSPVADLLRSFIAAWESVGDDRSRVRLALDFWAKSLRLGLEDILELST